MTVGTNGKKNNMYKCITDQDATRIYCESMSDATWMCLDKNVSFMDVIQMCR